MSARPAWSIELEHRVTRAFDDALRLCESPLAELARRPAEGAWSALETLEHVALANRFLLVLLEKIAAKARARAERGEETPDVAPSFDDLERISAREFTWGAPSHMIPTGRVPIEAVATDLRAQRALLVERLRELARGEGCLHTIRMSVIAPDARVDLYRLACFVALHVERHVRQARRALAPPDDARQR